MRLLTLTLFFLSSTLFAAEPVVLNKKEFREQWRAIPTIEAVYAASTPDGEMLSKSLERITASLTFTITAEGKAENITILSVSPEKPGYKLAFKQYYQEIIFKPLVKNPQTPATVYDTTYFGKGDFDPKKIKELEKAVQN